MKNEKDGKKARKGNPLSKIHVRNRGKDTGKQGTRRHVTGSETACNRERDGISPDSDGRPHELGRAPLYIGAPALICWSGRSKPSSIPL